MVIGAVKRCREPDGNSNPVANKRPKSALLEDEQLSVDRCDSRLSVDGTQDPAVAKQREAEIAKSRIKAPKQRTLLSFGFSKSASESTLQAIDFPLPERSPLASLSLTPVVSHNVHGHKASRTSFNNRRRPKCTPVPFPPIDSSPDSSRGPTHTDIDNEDDTDVAELSKDYIEEIFDHLCAREKVLGAREDYLDAVQSSVTNGMRTILVEWLGEVCEEFKLKPLSHEMAVNYFDRFLSQQRVAKKQLQLVGVTALLIACKYEEVYPPCISDFVYMTNSSCTKQEIKQMECIILAELRWQLTVGTPFHFLDRFLKASGVSDPVLRPMTMYLVELSLSHEYYISHLPSHITAAAVFVALKTLGHTSWNSTLAHYTGLSLDDVTPVATLIHRAQTKLYQKRKTKYRAIFDKYSAEKWKEVATRVPLSSLS